MPATAAIDRAAGGPGRAMIAGADKITVAPVGRVAAAVGAEAVGDARQQEFERSLAGLVGKSMQAEVLSRLTDGSYLVRIAGNPARMMLPSNPQPGAELPLTLVSLTPRPTFQLTAAPQSAAIPAFVDAASAGRVAGMRRRNCTRPTPGPAPPAPPPRPMQRAASVIGEAPPANQAAAADAASSHATLSATARVVSSVLVAAARAEHPQTSIVAPLPLLAAPPSDPAKLAAVLQATPSAPAACSTNRTWPNGRPASARWPTCSASRRCSARRRCSASRQPFQRKRRRRCRPRRQAAPPSGCRRPRPTRPPPSSSTCSWPARNRAAWPGKASSGPART